MRRESIMCTCRCSLGRSEGVDSPQVLFPGPPARSSLRSLNKAALSWRPWSRSPLRRGGGRRSALQAQSAVSHTPQAQLWDQER